MIKKMKQYFTKNKLSPTNNRKKVGIILFTTTIGLFFLFVSRLTYIVVVGDVGGTSLESKTEALYEGSKVVKAKRGTIYDRNGVVIAEDATSYSAYAPVIDTYVSGDKKLYAQEKDFETLAGILKNVLGKRIDTKKVVKTLQSGKDNNKYQVEIPNAKSLTLQQKQEIESEMEKKDVLGIEFNEHPSRIYPNGVFASHLIGYANVDVEDNQETLIGAIGIEAAYDDVLAGKDGEIVYQKDNFQNPLPGTVAESIPAEDGQDIYTTLDSRLQSYLDTLVAEGFEEAKPEYLTAVLTKSKTNEIVALSQYPSFNPETKEGIDEEKGFKWQNLFVEETYEPGSTIKILTVASAMEQGVFNPNETYMSGEMPLIDAKITDWDIATGSRGMMTMRQALSWSSNVGMVKLEQRMTDAWQEYLDAFGFGKTTNSGLFNEKKGLMPEDNIVTRANTAYGQGIAVTQFQMLQAFTAISNDGTVVKPSYIKKIVNPTTGEEESFDPEVVGQVFAPETAQQVRQYMRDVVEDEQYGTAYDMYKVDNYKISAKTGTAQIAEGGGYLEGENDNIYSVVTMLPAEDPEYTLYVTMKKPKEYKNSVIPTIANAILQRAMDFKEVDMVDTNTIQTDKVTVDDYRNLETEQARTMIETKGLVPVVIGEGAKIEEQSTQSNKHMLPGETLLLLTEGDSRRMPDTTGWSKSNLLKLANLLSMDVTFSGEGYSVDQSIEPGNPIKGKKLHFKLEKLN